MLEILSRSFVIPCSGYYHDVQEAVFRALMNKTKAVVDLVRPAGPGKTVNTNGTLLDDPKLREEVIQKRKELEEWMREVYVGAKLERIRSKKKYETRAQRWKVMWNSIVRDGKDADKILEAVKAPSVDHVLVEYITLNPRKRPYPGAPAPRLAFENDIQSELLQAQSTKNARPPTPPPRPRKTGFMDLIRESIANAPTFGFTQAPPPPQKPEADDGARNRVSKGNSNSKSSPEKNKKGHVDGAHDHDDHTNSGASRDHSPPILHMPKLEEDSDESLSHDHDVDLLDAIAALPFGMNGRYIPPISPPLPTPANEPEPEPEPEHSDEHGHHQPMEVHRRDGADGITHEEFRPKTLKRRGSSMKHPHIGWDVNGNLVDLSERKGEMHVKIVVPEEGCAPGAQPPEVHVGSRIRRGGVRRVNSFH
ncbi:hypothetical protein DFH27DRAFT_177940 [Peziza echinospora]|nr:hypothetical protein DFH27DRAFT_177940 [Peziza echinospora]